MGARGRKWKKKKRRTRKRNELCAAEHDEKLATEAWAWNTHTCPAKPLLRNCTQKCLILYSSWTVLSNKNVKCVCWFFIATGMWFDLFPSVIEWFLHRGLFPVVQCKKKQFETENTRIKVFLYVHSFQQLCKLPTQFKPSLDTSALQKQGMPVLV